MRVAEAKQWLVSNPNQGLRTKLGKTVYFNGVDVEVDDPENQPFIISLKEFVLAFEHAQFTRVLWALVDYYQQRNELTKVSPVKWKHLHYFQQGAGYEL